MTACVEEHRIVTRYAPPVESVQVTCFREVDNQGRHRGDHQGWYDQQPATIGGTHYAGGRRLVAWSRGSSVQNRIEDYSTWEPCPICGALTAPQDGDRTGWRFAGAHDAFRLSEQNLGGACGLCRTWVNRIGEYAAGWLPRSKTDRRTYRLVRGCNDDGTPSTRLQAWQNGITGAYGDRWYTVEWDDGDRAGPQSSLWDSGEIPWWLDDQFPPNAVVTPAKRQ